MRLVGANTDPIIAGVEPLPGRMNYFRGHDPKKWHAGVETYAKVRYEEVYPGIDVLYRGKGQQLEYDFLVAPGADPHRIKLRFQGVRQIGVSDRGELILRTAEGELRQPKPFTYQEAGGVRREVASRYTVNRRGEVGFAVSEYDATKPLVIDPVLVYSSAIGWDKEDIGRGVAVDPEGNLYLVGEITHTPPTPWEFGDQDVIVLKFDPSGTMLYGAVIGGDGSERGNAIAVDAAGNAYITGRTIPKAGSTIDFPITADAFATTRELPGPSDAFVMKLDTNAPVEESLVYSSYFNATAGTGIALDTAGMVYITGATLWGLPTTPGAFQESSPGSLYDEDAFVTKFDVSQPGPAGLIYSTYLGGTQAVIPFSAWDRGNAIAVDAEGSAIVAGETNSADFPVTGAYQAVHGGFTSDGFVTKLNAAGSALVYSTYLGGERWDAASGVAADAAGNAYVTGQTTSLQFPVTPDAYQPEWNAGDCGGTGFLPCADAFVTKFDPAGGAVYATYLGGYSHDYGYGIAADAEGNAYVTGYALSPNFPTANPLPGGDSGASDAFVTKLNPGGTAPLFSTYLGGGSGTDEGRGIAVDGAGNVYVVGQTESSDFPGGGYGGDGDAFVAKIALEEGAIGALVETRAVKPDRLLLRGRIGRDACGGSRTR